MEAEFIVISGPLLGTRFPLDAAGLLIGRAPSAQIRLTEPEVAWEHCLVRLRDGRYRLADCRSGTGTYVNGLRTSEHVLEPDDQISIGDTVMVYREDSQPAVPGNQKEVLLRACSLLFLFRAVAQARNVASRTTLETHALGLIADLVPCDGGAILLGRDEEELRASAREHSSAGFLEDIAARVYRDGSVVDADTRTIALGLFARGAFAGMLAACFPPAEAVHLAEHRDTLSAIVTLATAALENAREVERLQSHNALLRERLEPTGIVGQSAAIARLVAMIARVAPQDTSVLVLGESGTGKELVARALHQQSPRASQPFVAINCAAITETLLESEMFGHEKGAFTGAVAQKKGKLEVAEGGTVFLDEIGELATQLQAKLLRVLQQREFERVGGTRTMKLNVRLIAATNRDLAAESRRGAFREDLFHRLNVVALRVPPLRDRPDDIPQLARHFLELASLRCCRRVLDLSPEAVRCLVNYSWPGNVRELENAIERAVVLGQSDMILPEDLPETVLEAAAVPEIPGALQSSVTQTKRQLILNAWHESGGDHNQTAARLNIHPNSLRRLIRHLNLRDVLDA